MSLHLIIEEFSSKLMYIKGQHNHIVDALSRLDITSPHKSELKPMAEHLAANYALHDDNLVDAFPVTLS